MSLLFCWDKIVNVFEACKLPSYTEFFLIILKQTPYSSDEVRFLF